MFTLTFFRTGNKHVPLMLKDEVLNTFGVAVSSLRDGGANSPCSRLPKQKSGAHLPNLSREARLWTTVVDELPGGHSKGGGFSGAALEGSVALPSGADPRTGQRAPTQGPALQKRAKRVSALVPGLPVPGLSWSRVAGSPALPLRVPVSLLSSSCFFPLAAGVTFQLPAGGTSGQTQGHRPKNRSLLGIPPYAVFFNLDFAYGAASVLTDRGRVCRGGVRFR